MKPYPAALIVPVLVAAAPAEAGAHQQNVAITEIRPNAKTGLLEIAHRFAVHDAEHALSEILGRRVDLVGDVTARAAFSEYISGQFSIQNEDGPMTLVLLGAEIDGGYIWVYQEAPVPKGPETWLIDHRALQDVAKDQTNRLNLHIASGVETLVFEPLSRPKSVRFMPGDRAGNPQ